MKSILNKHPWGMSTDRIHSVFQQINVKGPRKKLSDRKAAQDTEQNGGETSGFYALQSQIPRFT